MGSGGFRVPGKLGQTRFRVTGRNPESGFRGVPGSKGRGFKFLRQFFTIKMLEDGVSW